MSRFVPGHRDRLYSRWRRPQVFVSQRRRRRYVVASCSAMEHSSMTSQSRAAVIDVITSGCDYCVIRTDGGAHTAAARHAVLSCSPPSDGTAYRHRTPANPGKTTGCGKRQPAASISSVCSLFGHFVCLSSPASAWSSKRATCRHHQQQQQRWRNCID